MMYAAPEMSPTLDDALHALDELPGRPLNVGPVVRFLEQLESLGRAPAVALDQRAAELLEGAYQAGFRTADHGGQVLVVSVPVFLEYVGAAAPAPRRTLADWLVEHPLAFLAGVLVLAGIVAGVVDHDARASAWLLRGASAVAVAASVVFKLRKKGFQ